MHPAGINWDALVHSTQGHILLVGSQGTWELQGCLQDPGPGSQDRTKSLKLSWCLPRGCCRDTVFQELGVEPWVFPGPFISRPEGASPHRGAGVAQRAATLPTSRFSSALLRRKYPSWNQRVQREGSQTDGSEGMDGRRRGDGWLWPAPLLRLSPCCPKGCLVPGPWGGDEAGSVSPGSCWPHGQDRDTVGTHPPAKLCCSFPAQPRCFGPPCTSTQPGFVPRSP